MEPLYASRMAQGPERLRLRFDRLSGVTRQLLHTEGESGRFEFKRNADAVGTSVLVAAANGAALEGLGSVTILVGVDERRDPSSGVVTGEVVGLDDLERARGRVTDRGSKTKPIPVGLAPLLEHQDYVVSLSPGGISSRSPVSRASRDVFRRAG